MVAAPGPARVRGNRIRLTGRLLRPPRDVGSRRELVPERGLEVAVEDVLAEPEPHGEAEDDLQVGA